MGYSLFAPGLDPMLLEVMFKLDSELLDKWKMVVAQLARQVLELWLVGRSEIRVDCPAMVQFQILELLVLLFKAGLQLRRQGFGVVIIKRVVNSSIISHGIFRSFNNIKVFVGQQTILNKPIVTHSTRGIFLTKGAGSGILSTGRILKSESRKGVV